MGSKNHQPVIFQQPAEKHHPTTTPIYFLTGMNVDNNNKIKNGPYELLTGIIMIHNYAWLSYSSYIPMYKC